MGIRPTRVSNDAAGGAAAWLLVLVAATIAAAGVAWVLVTMFERKQEARSPFVRVVEVSEISSDPEPWGLNWPHQFDDYKRTAGDRFYGGSSAMPESKLDAQPWLRRLYAGYAFSIDYREARGHAYMLYDQRVTERVTQRSQSGACLHCHASVPVTYRRIGLEAMGRPADAEALAERFDMDAVIRGFREVSTKPYAEVLAMVAATPDGTPDENEPLFPAPSAADHPAVAMPEGHAGPWEAHPVACIDCHDPKSMALRVTRPGFVLGIAALAASGAEVPHLPSIERWREGSRELPYDPNRDASRRELRSYVCGQCHVEYYCADKMVLTFPWGNGLRADDLERFWEEQSFPDGSRFYDFRHGETGAPVFKVQHPEFELWSQGVHARSGVSCADCHMPYERQGAMKVSSHNVRSPMQNINSACQQCHNVEESILRENVAAIQSRTMALMDRAAEAMTDMLDAIREAQAAGASEEALAEIFALQRKAMWRL
ncbi:MAG TPA: ammonia-forming cytochrome c nitrite reductase subunit c552, partial [Candidatus Polarisedimenticolaceae bacterium]|nr:ammonia-forming cytochrome c nitrite reductase subunit c552 [Candidatus Polarisedimenticolaceae bacterium]